MNRPRKQKHDESIDPTFRNTRSRLYHRKSSTQFKHDGSMSKDQSLENSGNFWKKKGNEAFKIHDYDKAIEYYSKAIDLNPGESQYYSNRSKCYQKKRILDKSLKDAETACQLDQSNLKAHYICGTILAELGKKDDSKLNKAQNRFKKALRLCRSKDVREYEEEVSIKMFRLKKLRWLKDKERELNQLELQKVLVSRALANKEITQQAYINIERRLEHQISAIKSPKEIPDHLMCKITLMLMEEPVVSEEGFTYERKVLEEHYRLKGPIEPITRNKVEGKFFPNHALKIAIEEFLKQNPWAFEEANGQDYNSIAFM